jgi:carbon storage regulator
MLVLTRRIGEVLVIGNGVRVTLIGTRRDRASLGVDAPPEVPVRRAELPDRSAEWDPPSAATSSAANSAASGALSQKLYERLKTVGAVLGLVRLQMDAGQGDEARAALAALQADFQLLLHGMRGELPAASSDLSGPARGAGPTPSRPRPRFLRPRRYRNAEPVGALCGV